MKVDIAQLIRTLIINGFHIININRVALSNTIIDAYKYDVFGAKNIYSVFFYEDAPSRIILSSFSKRAKRQKALALGIGSKKIAPFDTWFNPKDFIERLGGPVNSGLILIEDIPSILDTLGRNSLPKGLVGVPNDLYEEYIKESLPWGEIIEYKKGKILGAGIIEYALYHFISYKRYQYHFIPQYKKIPSYYFISPTGVYNENQFKWYKIISRWRYIKGAYLTFVKRVKDSYNYRIKKK